MDQFTISTDERGYISPIRRKNAIMTIVYLVSTSTIGKKIEIQTLIK